MRTPKVSVVIPCYNAQKYLRECLDSVVNQTLTELQIICVDDGSTDTTPMILEEYAQKDDRIKVITKANSGYGDSMNRGFDAAEGEYLGIVESDDFVELDMFEKLYNVAAKNRLDVCKAGYYQYSTIPEIKNNPVLTAVKLAGNKVFCPMDDFAAPGRQAEFFAATAAIWAGIYRKDFIRENSIRFNPTPGASYQDTGFAFKAWSKAKRVMFLNCCLLHYRVDNDMSSVHNAKKVYCICDEYEEIVRYLKNEPDYKERMLPLVVCSKYIGYLWNYERLAGVLQVEFLHRFFEEFTLHQQEGALNSAYFSRYYWNKLQMLLLDPDRYHDIHTRKLAGESVEDFYDAYPDHRPFRRKYVYLFMGALSAAEELLRESGPSGMLKLLASKVKNRTKTKKEKQNV